MIQFIGRQLRVNFCDVGCQEVFEAVLGTGKTNSFFRTSPRREKCDDCAEISAELDLLRAVKN